MNSTLDPFNFKTVSPDYSWDKGLPNAGTAPYLDFLTGFAENSAVSTENPEGVEYVGYAPYVFVALSSFPGDVLEGHQTLRREVNFGDYYNNDTNIILRPGLNCEVFCHTYIMPGLYTITYTRKEYIHAWILSTNAYGGCLQKYDINWTYQQLGTNFALNKEDRVTWASTCTGKKYQKRWKYEPPESTQTTQGLYVEGNGLLQNKTPLSWQWNYFKKDSTDPQNTAVPWTSASFQQPYQFTWAESVGPALVLPKRNTSLYKWRWNKIVKNVNLSDPFSQSFTWDQTKNGAVDTVTWDETIPTCDTTRVYGVSVGEQLITRKAYIRVLEIPPTAYIEVTKQSSKESYAPLTVRLSPTQTICGSFPIEKIVWDLGDGSPLLEQKRWANDINAPFVFNNSVSEDEKDPRNYDVVHTYYIRPGQSRSFYPSLTAYSSSTNTSDSAATTVGPLALAPLTGLNVNLIQNEITNHGKVILGEVGDSLVVWKSKLKEDGKEVKVSYRYPHLGYFSADKELINGTSKLFYTEYNTADPLRSLSGISDIDKDGNLDVWQTDNQGTVSWRMQVVYPYSYGTELFAGDEIPIKGSTRMYDSPGTGAVIVPNLSGEGVDIDGKGRLDSWKTDSKGILTWSSQKVHPYKMPGALYYTNLPITDQNRNKIRLWSSMYSDAVPVSNKTGIHDIDNDGNIDIWRTNFYGELFWEMDIRHPYPAFGSYWTDTPILTSGVSKLWSYKGSSGTIVSNISGQGVDLDNDQNTDTWTTDNNGTINWTMTIVHPYLQFGVYYSDTPLLTSGVSILYLQQGSDSEKEFIADGEGFVNNNLNRVSWNINERGVVTWYELTAHGIPWNGYYLDNIVITDGVSILWNGTGTGATPVTGISGTDDIYGDGLFEDWNTNSLGKITWVPAIRPGSVWKSVSGTDWFELSNWAYKVNSDRAVNMLPSSSTNVIILSNTVPASANIDDERWIEPNSIISYGEVIFYSAVGNSITAELTGTFTFEGSATYQPIEI